MKTRRRSIFRLAALATLLALPLHSRAADFTWNGGGGDGNFSTGPNWVGGSPPVSDLINTNLIFGGTLQLAPNLDSAFSTKGLTFDNTAGAFTFSGSTLSLGTSGIVNNSANTMTFANAVNFGGVASSTINAASGGLTFNNTVTMPTTTLTVMGAGTTMLSGPSDALAVGTGQTLQLNSNFTVDAGAQLTRASGGAVTLAAGKTLTLQNGGDATFTGGYSATTASTITVTGAGSTLNTTTASLNVYAGSTLNILGGAGVTISGGNLNLADTAGGGTLLVDGAGSTATATIGGLFVGFSGNAGNATFSNQASGSFNSIGVSDSVAAGSSGILNVQSGATITGTKLDMAPNAVVNSGTLTISGTGSSLTLNGSSASTIGAASASTATLNIQTGGALSTNSGTTTINPTGTVNLAGGTLNVRGVFDNNGTFNFTGGTLDVKTGGNFQSGTSTLTVPAGATLAINGGTYTSEGNLTIDGGTLNRSSGTFSLDASQTLSVQNGGSVNFTGNFTHNTQSTMTVTGVGSNFVTTGTLGLGGFGTVNVLNGGSLQSLSNISAFSPSILVDGSGSNLAGTSFSMGSGNLTFDHNATGSFNSFIGLGSAIAGTVVDVRIQNGSQVSTGSLFVGASTANTNTVSITGAGSSLTLTGAGNSAIGVASASIGTLNIQSGGTFTTNTGTLNLNATGTINLAGGTFTQNGPLNRAGGAFNFTSGTFNANVPFVAGASGALGSSVTLASGQTLNAASTVTIDSGSTLAVSGGTFNAQDNLTVNGSFTRDASSAFSVAAGKTMTVQGGGSASFTGAFNHNTASTITVTGAGSTLSTTGALSLSGGSTTNVLSGGSLSSGTTATLAAGSSLNIDTSTATFTGGLTSSGAVGVSGGTSTFNGALAHSGSFTVGTGATAVFNDAVSGPGNFSGTGAVDFRGGYSPGSSPGIVTIAGDAVFAPTNTLTMEIAGLTPGTQHDQIQVGGNTTLGGTVNLAFTSNSFFPQSGNSFVIMDTAGTFTNTATFTPSGLRSGWQFNTSYNGTTGELTVNSLSKGIPLAAPTANAVWNSSTGNWTTASSWSTSPNFPLNGNGGSVYNATQNGGTLTVSQAIDIDSFTMTGGTLNGSSPLTLSGPLTFSGGTMTGAGTISANGGATLSGGTKIIADGRILNLGGSSAWTAGAISIGNNGQLVVPSGATLETSIAANITNGFSASDGFFKIQGTFAKNGATTVGLGAGSGSFATENTGVVNVNGGTLAVQHRSTNTGDWNIASGATLRFDLGNGSFANSHNLNAGTDIVGVAGSTVQFAGNTTNFNAGTYNVAGTTQVIGGTVNFNAAAVTNVLTMSGGTLGGAATLTASGATTFSGGTMNGTGTFDASGGATLSGGSKVIRDGRVLNLGGSSTWTGGQIDIGNNGQLVVLSGATLETSIASNITNGFSASDGFFKIQGTFDKNGATTVGLGAGSGSFATENTGMVNVNGGTLAVQHRSANTGDWNIASGATLKFDLGHSAFPNTHNLNAGTDIVGVAGSTVQFAGATTNFNAGTYNVAGATQVTGGTVNFNAAAATSVLMMSGGTLGGSATVNVSGATTFSGGTMSGSGNVNANSGATFSGGTKNIGGRVLNLAGSSTWIGGQINVGNNGQLVVLTGATLDTSIAANITNGFSATNGTFTVHGTFNKTGATTVGLGTGSGSFTFSNTGIVNVSGGTLSIDAAFTQHSGTTLTGGTWNVTNGASISRTAGSNITTIGSGGSVMLDGAGSSFAKVTNTLNHNQGSLTLKNNRDLTTAGAYTNSGTTRVEDNTTVMTIGSGGSAAYTQTIGETVLVGGAMIDALVFNLNGGELKGNGTIASSVITGGTQTIAPGLSPGVMTIGGDLTLSAGSTLAMEIGGLTQGMGYDFLEVTGTLTLAGLLDLDLINGFENLVASNDVFVLASATGPILGAFGNVASGSRVVTNTNLSFDVWYGAGSIFDPNQLVVTGVPEPSRAALAMAGLMGVLMRRRRGAVREA